MTRLCALLTASAWATVLLASTATAARRTCATGSVYSRIEATNVSCKRAKKVIRLYFKDDTVEPFGFSCKPRQYPGGVTTTSRKGDRKVVHYSAD